MSITYTDFDYPKSVKYPVDWRYKFVHVTTDPSFTENLPCLNDCKFVPRFLPEKYKTIADRIHNVAVRADDVWVLCYPKSGSTWLQNIIWLLKNNLDYEIDCKVLVHERIPLLESAMLYKGNENDNYKEFFGFLDATFEMIDGLQSPRVIKTHLPMNLLPKQLWSVQPKIVYVARNPKDVAISFYYYLRNLGRYLGSLTEFLELFLNDYTNYAPFHNHVLNFWQLRHLKNLLFLTYEEMMADHFGVIKKISEFLECEYSDEQLRELTAHVSFDKMRENRAVNQEFLFDKAEMIMGKKRPDAEFRFIRKGKVGGFRDEMSAEMIKRFDEWTAESLKGSDFQFAV